MVRIPSGGDHSGSRVGRWGQGPLKRAGYLLKGMLSLIGAEKGFRERRIYPRRDSICLLSFVPKENGIQNSAVSIGRTLNISPSGLGLEAYQPIKPGSQLEMEIAIREDIFSIEGQVIHAQAPVNGKYFIGVKFNQVNGEMFKTLPQC